MKKLLFLIAIAVLTFNSSFAQDEETSSDNGIKFGAKIGGNLSTLTDDGDFTPSNKTGFHIGAVINIAISEKFSIQPEVVYSQQGAETSNWFSADNINLQLDYLNIPIMAEYKIIDGLRAQAGPQFGFNTSSKLTYKDDDNSDYKDNTASFDIGVGFGAQYELNFGLFFQARYVIGLSNVIEDTTVDPGTDTKNRIINLSVGYFFN